MQGCGGYGELGRLTGLVCESSACGKGEARLAGWLAGWLAGVEEANSWMHGGMDGGL